MSLVPVLAAFAAAALLYSLNIINRWKYRKLPGPRPWPFFGNLPQLGEPTVAYRTVRDWTAKYGDMFIWYLGRRPFITISDPELVKKVGVKTFMSFHDRGDPILVPGGAMDTKFTYSGMLFAEGRYWATLRAACEPLFHSRMLESYATTMTTAADRMVELLKGPALKGESVNISEAGARLTMDVIGNTAFGVDFDAQRDEKDKPSELFRTAKAVFEPIDAAGPGRIIPLLCFAIPPLAVPLLKIGYYLGMQRFMNVINARRYLWSMSQVLLDNSRAKHGDDSLPGSPSGKNHNAGNYKVVQQEDEATKWIKKTPQYKRAYSLFQNVVPAENSLIYKLRNANAQAADHPMRDIDISSQSFTFVLAGYETTSLALGYTLYELAKDPVLQQRVRQEVASLGKSGPIRYESLAQAPLLEAVFNESLRLWPPVTFVVALNRAATKTMELGGHTVYKGDRVLINIRALHMNPKHFPEPEKFKPERFLPGSEEAENRHPHAYIPFGLGPRRCIGMRLAIEECLIVLARMLQNYSWTLDEEKHRGELELHSFITLMPLNGIWLKLKPLGNVNDE